MIGEDRERFALYEVSEMADGFVDPQELAIECAVVALSTAELLRKESDWYPCAS